MRKPRPRSELEKIKRHRRDIKRKYGVTESDYLALLLRHSNACGICKQPFKNQKDTHIDHSHITGKVRGLLCSRCNSGIGLLQDSAELALAAHYYLKEN